MKQRKRIKMIHRFQQAQPPVTINETALNISNREYLQNGFYRQNDV